MPSRCRNELKSSSSGVLWIVRINTPGRIGRYPDAGWNCRSCCDGSPLAATRAERPVIGGRCLFSQVAGRIALRKGDRDLQFHSQRQEIGLLEHVAIGVENLQSAVGILQIAPCEVS